MITPRITWHTYLFLKLRAAEHVTSIAAEAMIALAHLENSTKPAPGRWTIPPVPYTDTSFLIDLEIGGQEDYIRAVARHARLTQGEVLEAACAMLPPPHLTCDTYDPIWLWTMTRQGNMRLESVPWAGIAPLPQERFTIRPRRRKRWRT